MFFLFFIHVHDTWIKIGLSHISAFIGE